jgi:hypothetical protein
MDLEMVLNELSLRTPASDIQTARLWMSDLVSIMRRAISQGVKRVVRTHSGFHAMILAPGYPLARWRNDDHVDLEVRRYFSSLSTKVPFLTDLQEPEIENNILLSEFHHEGEKAHGLGIAFLCEALALSVRSAQRWELSRLEVKAKWLRSDGNLSTERVMVIHASRVDHVLEHDEWIKDRLKTSVRDGIDLWNRRGSLFPSLSFCEAVAKQMQNLRTGNPMLRPIVRRLFELEGYCKGWETGSFNPDALPTAASPESQSTLQQFGRERTFRCPDGRECTFSWHVRLSPGAWRIHFLPEAGIGTMIIGYIGPHLPTVNDPT